MAVADLVIGTVVLPRTDSPKAISNLAKFKWFHKIDTSNETVTPEIDDLLIRIQKTYQSIDEVIKGLQIPLQVGIMEILFKGTVIKKKKYELDELESMINDLEKKTPSVIENAQKILEEDADVKRSLEEYTSLKETLQVVKKLDLDLGNFGLMKYFYTNLFVISSSGYAELTRTLEDVTIYKYDLESKDKAAVLIISSLKDADKINKVIRNLNATQFSIPQGITQVPSKAYALAESKIKELKAKQKTITKNIATLSKKIRRDILSLHETAFVAKDVLETIRKPGGTKRFAVIQGYIPKNLEKQFKETTKQWMSITEEVKDREELSNLPVKLDNPRWVRTYQVITESQGIPKKGEYDPTWMIALMWPIFYGIMFADLGHGLLLMGLGLLFKFKGQGNLSRWGMLLAMSGGAGAVAGVFQGEVFGFHLEHFVLFESLLHEGGPLYSI